MSDSRQIDNRPRFDGQIKEIDFPLVGRGVRSRFIRYDPQRTINFYRVYNNEGKKKAALFPTSGRQQIYTMPSNTTARSGGAIAAGGFQYQVFGSSVIKIAPNGIQTNIGTISTVIGYVGMISIYSTAASALMIVIVDGNLGWTYNTSTGSFLQITDVNFPTPCNAVCTLDGFVIYSKANSPFMKVSALGDPRTIPGSIQMQTLGENIQQLAVLHKRMFVFGQSVTEVFYNTGVAPSIFAGDYNLRIEYGCESQATVTDEYGYIFWVGRPANGSPQILMTNGTQPKVISDENLNRIIANFSNPSDCEALIYQDTGNIMYEVSWTTDDQTWFYVLNTNTMEEKSELGHRSALRTYTYFNNTAFVGLYNDNNLYEFGEEFGNNGTDNIHRTRITSVFSEPFYHPINITRMIVDCLPGEILDAETPPNDPNLGGPPGNPYIYISISRDGGYTFEPPRKVAIGMAGEYRNRAIIDNLGRSRAWVFRFDIYTSAIQAILGAAISYWVEST